MSDVFHGGQYLTIFRYFFVNLKPGLEFQQVFKNPYLISADELIGECQAWHKTSLLQPKDGSKRP